MRTLTAFIFLSCTASPLALAQGRMDFNRDVRPILSDTCFKCHGPDPASRKADLALHIPEQAVADRGGFAPIIPGRPDQSEAYRRIVSPDRHELMPPPKSGMKLSPRQIETIRKWIEQGAEYQPHWSFIPPKRPALPAIKQHDWPRNGIDHFVLAELESEGLKPSPEADKTTLIRRASLDLRGIPPSLAELDEFLNDSRPDACERLIDRLLASRHFGERMAAIWLDAARYADTSGYQADWERHMWPWRDWVVRAYNANMPFDRFTIEQIAGDMLPTPTLDQRLATGFNRNHRINDEGGIIPEEYAVEYVVDRVDTTATVWLGLTAGCARCHDHKYDPITQKEFYRLYAYFNNVPEKGQDGRAGFAAPFLRVTTPEMARKVEELEAHAADMEKRLEAPSPAFAARLAEWNRSMRQQLAAGWKSQWSPAAIERASASNGPVLQIGDDESVVANNISPETTVYTAVLTTDAPGITGLRLDILTHESLPDGRLGRGDGNFLLGEVEIEVATAQQPKARPVKIKSALADYSQERFPIEQVLDRKPATGWAVDGDLVRGQRTAAFIFDAPVGGPGTTLTVKLAQGSKKKQQTIGRFRLSLTTAQTPAITGIEALPEDITAALRSDAPPPSHAIAHYFRTIDPELAPQWKKLIAGRRAALDLADQGVPVMVMQEMAAPRDTYLLKRGQYDQPDKSQKLSPGLPAALAHSATNPSNRLEFAKWLVSEKNPLTARVAVNRFWQTYFATGLVKTSEDFGAQGEWPSHPALLDWLATEFVRTGWDVKAMQKLILTSATYRQSSKLTPALLEKDPDNRLLARASRFRLDAHGVRDNALGISGLLVPRLGGPTVKPYQPPGLWEELSFDDKTTIDAYSQDKGDNLYRRTLYTFWKRTAPPPAMAIFDAGGREMCSVRSSRTNTPLQALNLLNDVTYVEAARALAQRIIREGGQTPRERLVYAWRLATARKPSDRELSSLQRALDQYLARYETDPAAASALLKVGESKRDDAIDAAEHAAYTAIANVILNLDETLTRE